MRTFMTRRKALDRQSTLGTGNNPVQFRALMNQWNTTRLTHQTRDTTAGVALHFQVWSAGQMVHRTPLR
jgi:hypothetical protein